MSGNSNALLARRIGSIAIDLGIECSGGLLGSYFGAMVAALVTAISHHNPLVMQDSIWRGLGFGFVFCSLAIAFVNRVLIQGLSRSSLGKKFFGLEIVTSKPFTWQLMIKRWVLSQIALATGGLGYVTMFFTPENRALHDIILGTDVVMSFAPTYAVSMEYHETLMFPEAPRILVFTNDTSERPMATVIQLHAGKKNTLDQSAEVTKVPVAKGGSTLAEVIQLQPADDQDEKKVA